MPMTYKGLKYAGYHKVECEQKRCTARDFAGLAMGGRLYIAAAGKLVTPGGAVEVCHILGKEETLRRLQKGIAQLG